MATKTIINLLLVVVISLWESSSGGGGVAWANKISCTNSEECKVMLGSELSQCTTEGYCDNPYQYGCLQQHQQRNQTTKKLRICNSEDPPDAASNGKCRPPKEEEGGLSYKEIRLLSQNWESPFFEVWILQILLSELLDVPVTIETGQPDKHISFYDPEMRFDYGIGYDWIALERASNNPDCTTLSSSGVDSSESSSQQSTTTPEDYTSCAHAILEVWSGYENSIQQLKDSGLVEPSQFLGVIGEEGWLLPKYTAEADSSLTGYFGLKGEENRRKLAERFWRPTTWKEYCDQVDPNHCLGSPEEEETLQQQQQQKAQTPVVEDDAKTTFVLIPPPPVSNNSSTTGTSVSTQDDHHIPVGGAATRPPQTPEEEVQFFAGPGLYTGHFRKTEENDCDKNPTTCTGHFLDYPCGWTSFFLQQAYHLDIALKGNGLEGTSGGYSYARSVEIWHAANYTKSDVIGWWWRPDGLFQEFLGTDFELQAVNFPPPHHQCVDRRLSAEDRCVDDPQLQVFGDPLGVCDVPPFSLNKVLSTGLYKLVYEMDIPDALISPAYEVIKEFSIDSFDLEEIFGYWLNAPTGDKYGFDPRYAVCRWVSENYEDLQRFVPLSYPRGIQQVEGNTGDRVIISMAVIAAAGTVIVSFMTYKMRNKRAFTLAQIEFVYLLLAGMLMISTAAVLTAIPPTDTGCVAAQWLVNIGYSFELVPLIVKIAAIHHLMSAAKKMKRVKLSRPMLLRFVGALTMVVVVYMVIWTALDPPHKTGEYKLTGKQDDDGQTIITLAYYCDSRSRVWRLASVGAQTLLLLCATVLSFLTRKTKSDVNETNILCFLIYWNFVCVLLRTILVVMEDQIDNSAILTRYLSIILSLDSMVTIGIYFIPKFLDKREGRHGSARESSSSAHTSTVLRTVQVSFNGAGFHVAGQNSFGSQAYTLQSSRQNFRSGCEWLDRSRSQCLFDDEDGNKERESKDGTLLETDPTNAGSSTLSLYG